MTACSTHLSLLLVMTVAGSVSAGSIRLRESSDLDSRRVRSKRHVILDNEKLCNAVGCVNGYCKESELRNYRIVCECFTGYEGKLCDRLKCPYDCGKHGKCVRNGLTMYCKCDEGYYGRTCDSRAKHSAKMPTHISSKAFMKALNSVIFRAPSKYNAKAAVKRTWFAHTVSPKIKFSEFHSHAEIDTSVKPDLCAPGFQCYHGRCDRKSIMKYGIFRCRCKKNYAGLFCDKRCTLSCKNNGSCMVLNDGHQKCDCPFSHTGHYCEKPYPSNT